MHEEEETSPTGPPPVLQVDGQPLRRRLLVDADAPAVLALVHDYDRAFYGEPLADLADLLAEWQAPGFDLARDSLAYEDGDGLAAVGLLDPRGLVDVSTRGRWRGLGVEGLLLDELEARARARGLAETNAFVADGDAAGAERLQGRGYRLHHTSWILQLDPGAPVATRTLPAGYAVRPFRPEDAEAAFAVVSAAFGEWQTGPPRTFEDWTAEVLRRPGVDPSAFRVATYQGEVVGTCVVFDGEDEAWVSQLATAREHRGRGVAQQLLAESYAAARQRGLLKGGLSTDTRTGALDLYQRLGMRVLHTVHNWSLDLTAPAGPAAG